MAGRAASLEPAGLVVVWVACMEGVGSVAGKEVCAEVADKGEDCWAVATMAAEGDAGRVVGRAMEDTAQSRA